MGATLASATSGHESHRSTARTRSHQSHRSAERTGSRIAHQSSGQIVPLSSHRSEPHTPHGDLARSDRKPELEGWVDDSDSPQDQSMFGRWDGRAPTACPGQSPTKRLAATRRAPPPTHHATVARRMEAARLPTAPQPATLRGAFGTKAAAEAEAERKKHVLERSLK